MRILLATTAVAAVLGLTSPTYAMCGGGAGMCGTSTQTQAQAPMSMPEPNATPGEGTPQKMGGCACCKNMAMMQGGQGGKGSMDAPKPQ